ncbi:MAG: helix-turn-helix transcriptional regulator [Solobacterium sp.]|nr:helix-turn-helix transcriptional regulator [Solobacterium sp.]
MQQFHDMTIEEKLACFSELMSCGGDFNLSTYDTQGNLIASTASGKAMHKLFEAAGLLEYLLKYCKSHRELLILSITQGLLWAASFETDSDDNVAFIHVYGPVATMDLTAETIAVMINNSKITESWRPKFRKILRQIPVVMSSVLFQQAIMLNYCVTGKKVGVADMVFYSVNSRKDTAAPDMPKRDRIQTYMAEQELLRMVREGNLFYKKALERAASVSLGVGSGDENALRHAITSQIVFISLCTRAAIEGGLSPETAYTKGDAYISDVMQCRSVTDAVQIGHTMYTDFIQTVHNRRNANLFSPAVQSCCDYIDTHLESAIKLEKLARRVGYSEYYLSRKFKTETGMSINEYIRDARINRAKILLATTEMSIQNISDRLCFGNRSFFADTFRKIVGTPPAEYRKQNQKL